MATPAAGLKACTLKVNLFSGARTPLPEGILRWIAGRCAGIPNFEPPYTLE